MTIKDDGGSAFPEPIPSQCGGMTLRDYFAAEAMSSLTPVYWEDFESYDSGAELIKCQIETAYEMADQMLKERAK